MIDTKYNLSEMLERRIRRDVEPTVRTMQDAMRDGLEAEITKLDLDNYDGLAGTFAAGVAAKYREKLVRDAMSAAVDGMLNGKPIKHEDAAPVSAPAPALTPDFYIGQEFGAALCDHFGLPGNQVAAGVRLDAGIDDVFSATVTVFLTPADLSGIATKMASPRKA